MLKRGGRLSTCLFGDKLVRLVEDGAALRVAEDDPVEANVLELREPVDAASGVVFRQLTGRAQGSGVRNAMNWRQGSGVRTRSLRCRRRRGAGERSGRRPRFPCGRVP